MNFLRNQLPQARAFIRDNVAFPGTPQEHAAFTEYAAERTHRTAVVVCVLVIIADLVAWPFDRLLFNEADLQRQIANTWRSIVLVAAIAFALLNLRPPGWLRGSRLAITLEAMLISMVPAYALGLSVGVDQPAFGALYFTCFSTIAMLFPLGARILASVAIMSATLAAFFLARPENLHHPLVGIALGCSTSMMVGSIGIGQAMYLLSRRAFLQSRALAERAEDLTRLDRAKSDFFANISHELRTPLTLIVGSFQQLNKTSRDPSVTAAVEPGLRNAGQLLRLINELLELARHDADHGAPERRTIDLALLVRRSAANFTPAVGDALTVLGANAPMKLAVDPRQLRMVVDNLLSNALKFTDPSRRRIVVKLTATNDSVRLEVTDNGAGIDPELLPRVFDRFVQGTSGTTRRFAGTGIGLALVREVVVRHGGTVDVTSRLGEGSTFTVSLPRVAGPAPEEQLAEDEPALPAPGPATEPSAGTTAGAKVLVVDDHPDLRAYLSSLLSPHYQVAAAEDGREALDVAQRFRPDLVVTDVMMPNVDGQMLLQQLRQTQDRATLPVLFLTARAGVEARSEALELGADDYLTKPFDERDLLARVRNLLAGSDRARALAQRNEALERRATEHAAALRALARSVEEVQESERARIAADLHDELGQLLTIARLDAELASIHRDVSAFDRITRRLEEALEATRSVVLSLRAPVLEHLGLTAGLNWLLERSAARGTVDCGWNLELDDDHIPPPLAGTIFRLVQESLTNIDRHSKATRAHVEVTEEAGVIRIIVEDDGIGFDPGHVDGTGHVGLSGMRDRARAQGGTLHVQSARGQGTRIEARLPLPLSKEAS